MVLKCKRITVLELVLWNSLYCFLVFNYAFENVLLENKSSCSIFQFTLLYPKAYFALSSQCCCAKKPSCGFCTITFFGIGFSSSIIFFTFTLKKSVTLLNCLHKGQSTIKRIFMSLAYKNTLNPNNNFCPIRFGSFGSKIHTKTFIYSGEFFWFVNFRVWYFWIFCFFGDLGFLSVLIIRSKIRHWNRVYFVEKMLSVNCIYAGKNIEKLLTFSDAAGAVNLENGCLLLSNWVDANWAGKHNKTLCE